MAMSGMDHTDQDDHMLAPAEPTQSRFYIQDKLEFKDVVVQLRSFIRRDRYWSYGTRFR